MAMNILDQMVKNLQAVNAKQGRIAVSGNLAGMRIPPAVLSHEWRLGSPGSHAEPDPKSRSAVDAKAYTAMAVTRAGRSAASRSGSLATSRTSPRPFTTLRQNVRHDCQSNVCREARLTGLTGRLSGRGMVPAEARGKRG
jgi:hypothetical protein